MVNAFDLLTKASKSKATKKSPPCSPKSKQSSKARRKTTSCENNENVLLLKSDEDGCLAGSPKETQINSPPKVKRLRKRITKVTSKYSDEDDDDFSLSPKRHKTENTFSAGSFSLGDDESMLQPKPKRSFVSKQILATNNNGIVPDLFKTVDQRKAEMRTQKTLEFRQSTIVLPKSIAHVTAKEIDRLAGQVVELTGVLFPSISMISTTSAVLNCDFEPPCNSHEFSSQYEFSMDDCRMSEFLKENNGADPKDEISVVNLKEITDDESRDLVKQLESQNREFSMRPMLRRFLVHQDWSNKLYSEMFCASCGDDMLGLSSITADFSNWLITYSMAANQMIEVLRKRRPEDTADDLLLNAESTCIAIVSGPPGIGKTSFVKAAAADLNYKVVEVNTSQCRSQKNIISQLKDGLITQKVSSCSTSGSGIEGGLVDGGGKSLILVDDADVVMNEDANFVQAVCTLAQMSHKPVVLTVANEESLSGVRVSFKQFRLTQDRSRALSVLLQCICITKRTSIDPKLLDLIAKKNNFHYALNALQIILENKLFCDSFRLPNKFSSLASELHTSICNDYEKNTLSKFEEVQSQSTKHEMELAILSKKLDMNTFSANYKFTTFQTNNCRVWSGDTTREDLAKLGFSPATFPKIDSYFDMDKFDTFDEMTESYHFHCPRSNEERFSQIFPYIGGIGIINDDNKRDLESKDQRKIKRYCHYLDTPCNLGFSDPVKEWVAEFYRFRPT